MIAQQSGPSPAPLIVPYERGCQRAARSAFAVLHALRWDIARRTSCSRASTRSASPLQTTAGSSSSPADRRVGEREVLDDAVLDLAEGLVGDMWRTRPSTKTADGSAHPDMQVTLMNARCRRTRGRSIPTAAPRRRPALRRPRPQRRERAAGYAARAGFRGDRDHRDSTHRLCEVRAALRPGRDAIRELAGRAKLNLRGVNAKVVVAGTVETGDTVRKI